MVEKELYDNGDEGDDGGTAPISTGWSDGAGEYRSGAALSFRRRPQWQSRRFSSAEMSKAPLLQLLLLEL